jgi:hypothetical protein
MRPCLCLAALLVAACPPARADEPRPLFDGCNWWFPKLCAEWRARHCWCPDDYCPKKLPCVPCTPRGCVDDYCPKKLPCVPCNPRGCVDDYCPKTCPIWLGPLCQPWYTCGPPEPCGAPCQKCPAKH